MATTVVTRIAPSPTGRLHVGSLRTALYNYLYARKHGGKFIVRIEDTDRARLVPGAAEDIFDNLRWAGLEFDGAPQYQSQRLPLYQSAADQLVLQGSAYYCFCTPDRLDALRRNQQAQKLPVRYDSFCRRLRPTEAKLRHDAGEKTVIRFAMPKQGSVAYTDLVRGNVTFNAATLDDQVLVKSDGFPTYHLASVVDDHDTGVTHVIRGEEWLPSTPKHLLLYQAFRWQPPQFAHLPLLLNPDRSKLSKRTGDVAVGDYRQGGYLPEALLNFILLLGWNPGTDQEIFSRDEMVKLFDLERVNRSGAIFNSEKLDWINGWYLRHKSPEELQDLATPYLERAGLLSDRPAATFLRQVLQLEQNRLKKLGDLPNAVAYFFRRPQLDPKILPWRGQNISEAQATLQKLAAFLENFDSRDFQAPTLEKKVKAFIAEGGGENGPVLWPFRTALTGRKASPGPFEIGAVLGKDETIARVKSAAVAGNVKRA